MELFYVNRQLIFKLKDPSNSSDPSIICIACSTEKYPVQGNSLYYIVKSFVFPTHNENHFSPINPIGKTLQEITDELKNFTEKDKSEMSKSIVTPKEQKKVFRYTLETIIDIPADNTEYLVDLNETVEKSREFGSCEIKSIETVFVDKD